MAGEGPDAAEYPTGSSVTSGVNDATVVAGSLLAVQPDGQLVVMAQCGHAEAREELARRFRRPAYLLALQLTGHTEDAKDVAQDALMRFFGSLDRFDSHRPVLPWLFRIVSNRVRDERRRRRVRRTESLDSLVEDGRLQTVDRTANPRADAERRELQRRIWSALGTLKPAHREILVLRDYQDLSYAEIAVVLGVRKGTVMSRLHRARKALRDVLIDRQKQGEFHGAH